MLVARALPQSLRCEMMRARVRANRKSPELGGSPEGGGGRRPCSRSIKVLGLLVAPGSHGTAYQ